MPEIEDRLRSALHDLADEVPTSTGARAELGRRLAGRPRRPAPMWAATAAAVVVAAAVAVPVALSGNSPPTGVGAGGDAPTVSTSVTTSPPESVDLADLMWPGHIMPPTPVVSSGVPGETDYRVLTVALTEDFEMCWRVLDSGGDEAVGATLCEPTPEFVPGHLVESRDPSDLGLELPTELRAEVDDHLIFLVAPDVVRMDVRRGDGTTAPPVLFYADHDGMTGMNVAVTDFDGPTEGFGYTAYDRDDTVVEEAIT